MYRSTLFTAIAAGALLVLLTPGAQAEPGAIMPARTGIDPNTFIVGHPASPRWQIVHANGEHPAVLQARQAAAHASEIDPNHFLVQPPAAVTWVVQDETQLRLAKAK